MQPLTVIATIRAKPGQEARVREQLRSLLAPTRAEAGCLRYELNQGEDESAWVMVELWASKDALNAHMEPAHFAVFKAVMPETVEDLELFVGSRLD